MRQVREIIALAMLVLSSYTDIRERYIYLVPVTICTGGGIVLSVLSVIFSWDTGIEVLSKELIIPAAAGIILIALAKTAGRHIGCGDGYLLAALIMITGMRICAAAAACGLFAAAIFAAFRIACGKSRTACIPFAPFILTGFIAVLIYGI